MKIVTASDAVGVTSMHAADIFLKELLLAQNFLLNSLLGLV